MILVAGCSYVQSQDWPIYLFGKNVISVGHGGACNWIISESVIKNINCDTDFVYAQFSGVNRFSVPVTNELAKTITDQNIFLIETGNKTWIASGGFHGSWQFLKAHSPYYNVFKNYYSGLPKHLLRMHTEYSLHHVINFLNFLEKKNIKYCFGWIYDIFQSTMTMGQGTIDKTHSLYKEIPWQKLITKFQYETAKAHNELQSDKAHPTPKGYVIWCDLVKEEFKQFGNPVETKPCGASA